jgi:hypothetical protein
MCYYNTVHGVQPKCSLFSISGHTMYDIRRESKNDLSMKEKYGFHICQIIEHVLKTQKSYLFSAYQKTYQDPYLDLSHESISGVNIA